MDIKEKLAALAALTKRSSPSPAQVVSAPVHTNQAHLGKQDNVLFLGTPEDVKYVPLLKPMMNGCTTYVLCEKMELLGHLEMYCSKRGVNRIVSTNTHILSKLLETLGNHRSSPKLSEYAGSVFEFRGLQIVFIDPLKQLFTVSYGKFVTQRYISKLVAPAVWREATAFSWTLLKPENIESFYQEFINAYAISADIETFRDPLSIRCIGFTGIFISPTGDISTRSIVLPMDSTWALTWMRKFCSLPAQKIFQNGKYDCSYLLRYNSPPENWLWDTAHFMHSWYAELPKDLAFLNAFFLRKVVYWKDLAETNDLFEYYKYNALDTWATANVWIQQMLLAPDWARRNYQLEFPLVYPCLLAELTGIKRDTEKLVQARAEVDGIESKELSSLQKMIPKFDKHGQRDFNPGSPKQVGTLMDMLGNKDLESTNEKDIKKAILRHPLNGRILEKVLTIRGLRKLATTYLRLPSDAIQGGIHAGEGGSKEFSGRVLYSLNPHGTDTGRLASREHHFWCGLQIQNIPRGEPGEPSYVKQTICADDGFYLGECDLEQAESRDTAHISGDEALIAAVSGTKDFHSVNASSFFGVSYASIYDDTKGKTKDKKLRDLAKRVNHGANYNMGPGVLIDTMGLDKIWEARSLLKLVMFDPKDIAQHLLDQFHKTYRKIKGAYYPWVIVEVSTTKLLVSRAYHHTEYNERVHGNVGRYIEEGDWTRYCFGNPGKNKSDLNAYVAHCPQSLNSRTLNEAFMSVFYRVALPNPGTFRLHAQIHDSILFSYAPGTSHPERVRDIMQIPCTVRDVSGTYRTFTVPAALKLGKEDKPAIYWSETE